VVADSAGNDIGIKAAHDGMHEIIALALNKTRRNPQARQRRKWKGELAGPETETGPPHWCGEKENP